jgi:hypothetical protein
MNSTPSPTTATRLFVLPKFVNRLLLSRLQLFNYCFSSLLDPLDIKISELVSYSGGFKRVNYSLDGTQISTNKEKISFTD